MRGLICCFFRLSALGIVLLSTLARGEEFPFAYTPEPPIPAWPFARVEGRNLSYLVDHFSEYTKKFMQKKFSAPQEEIAHFNRQKALQEALRAEAPHLSDRSSMALVGDVMWIGKSWDSFLSPDVLSFLNGHRFVFGNLESPVVENRPPSKPAPVRFVFNSPPELVTAFRRNEAQNTFSALSVINNHALDQGEEGLAATLSFLQSQGVAYSGARQGLVEKNYAVVERDGFKVGFYAAGFGLNDRKEQNTEALLNILPGLAPDDKLFVEVAAAHLALQEMARDGVDMKIVSLHWGFEFEVYPHPHQMVVARELIRAGADILMGHHPHVQQPDEVCFVNGAEEAVPLGALSLARESGCLLSDGTGVPRRALVVYSLGNFLTSMKTFLCQLGLVKSLDFGRDQSGRVSWAMPRAQYVFNEQNAPPNRGHLLVLWEEYQRQNCFRSRCSERDLREFERMSRR